MLPDRPQGGGGTRISLHALCASGLLFCKGTLETKATFFTEVVSPMVAFTDQKDGKMSLKISKNHE